MEADELYLTKLWVTGEARRAGHGAALVGEYLAAGARHGFRRFRLDVFSGNHAAIRLYRSCGFEILEERTSELAGMSYTSMVLADRSGRQPSELGDRRGIGRRRREGGRGPHARK